MFDWSTYIPADLGPSGLRIWDSFADDHSEDPDELILLERIARLHDTLDALEEDIRDHGIRIKGQNGSTLLNQSVSERRMTAKTVADLLRQLGYRVTEDGGSTPASRSEAARHAARQRWDNR